MDSQSVGSVLCTCLLSPHIGQPVLLMENVICLFQHEDKLSPETKVKKLKAVLLPGKGEKCGGAGGAALGTIVYPRLSCGNKNMRVQRRFH